MTPELKDFRVTDKHTDSSFRIITGQSYLQACIAPMLLRWEKALWLDVSSWGGQKGSHSLSQHMLLHWDYSSDPSFKEDTVVEGHWCYIRCTSMWFCDTRKHCMLIRLLDAISASWMVWIIWTGSWGRFEGRFGHSVWNNDLRKGGEGFWRQNACGQMVSWRPGAPLQLQLECLQYHE